MDDMNIPEPDYEYYLCLGYWTLLETIAIFSGVSPAFVSNSGNYTKVFHGHALYGKMRVIFERSQLFSEYGSMKAPIDDIMDYVKLRGIPLPANMQTVINEIETRRSNKKSVSQSDYDAVLQENRSLFTENRELRIKLDNSSTKSLHPKERESVAKIIVGMAIKGYSYDPKKIRSSTVAEIQSDLDELGISLDDATIRKWIKEGEELLPNLEEVD